MSNSVLEIKGKIVSIDGNIGAGKSSILKELKNLGYVVFPEDIDSWQPILNNFYSNPKRWAFTLQITILNNLRDQYRQINEMLLKNSIIFIERAPSSSKIFAEICKNAGHMTDKEFNIYCGCFEKLIWESDVKLYIETDVPTCMQRITKRGRECEQNIDINYLHHIAASYEKCHFNGYFPGKDNVKVRL